jgi:hypothetical protein
MDLCAKANRVNLMYCTVNFTSIYSLKTLKFFKIGLFYTVHNVLRSQKLTQDRKTVPKDFNSP